MSITRRVFVKNGALAIVGTAALPTFLRRTAQATVASGAENKRLVVIFQRGAADGLNIVVPHGEPAYYAMRPSINIPGVRSSIWTASSDSIPPWPGLSRCGTKSIWPSCTPQARLIPRVLISMRRTSWNRARPGSRQPRMAG